MSARESARVKQRKVTNLEFSVRTTQGVEAGGDAAVLLRLELELLLEVARVAEGRVELHGVLSLELVLRRKT